MAWNNPLPAERVLDVIQRAELPPGSLVVDVGCGTGELLAHLAAQGQRVHGVDVDAELIAEAIAAAPTGARFDVGSARTWRPEASPALACCLGASQAFGEGPRALPATARTLRSWVPEGGWALVGELYARGPVPDPFAAFLGTPTGLERTHADVVETLEAEGWRCVHAITASEAEWDAFEWAHFRQHGRTHWRDAWLRWGRSTMGFGCYLLQTA